MTIFWEVYGLETLCQSHSREEWRSGRDLNPRYRCQYAALAKRCFRPLSHLTVVEGRIYGEIRAGVKGNSAKGWEKSLRPGREEGKVGPMSRLPRVFLRLLLAASLLGGMNGCATLKKIHLFPKRKARPVPQQEAPAPRQVGTVVLVNENAHFVLIDTAMAPPPATGTALKTFTGETESGVLAVGQVRRRPFVVADIVKGEPKKGDRVLE